MILGRPSLADQLTTSDLGAEVARALQVVVRIRDLQAALEELDRHLSSGDTQESIYQRWCERHSWVFGNAYVARDDIRQIALGDSIDILLKSSLNGLRDIFELKRPDQEAIKWDTTHRSWYWSRETSQAIGQCHRYLDALHEAAQHGLRDHRNVIAYHPRAFIVIGRSADWQDDQYRALHGLNARLHGITVMTYDQLAAQARAMLDALTSTESTEQ